MMHMRGLLEFFIRRGCDVYGRWHEAPAADICRGIVLRRDGTASSVNMVPVSYTSWRRHGRMLVLAGTVRDGARPIDFTETFQIRHLSRDNMVLQRDGQTHVYMRVD